MYIFFIVLIIIASFLLILTVLAQNPKGGMAANFGASNQVMGVRQTADFLEKLTWGLAITILALSFAATMAMPKDRISASSRAVEKAIESQSGGIQNPFQLPGTSGASGASEASGTSEASEATPVVPVTPNTPDPEGR